MSDSVTGREVDWPAASSPDRTASPVRTCVGCRKREDKANLVRIIATERELVIDEGSTAPGRGAYLHRSPDCLAYAVRRRAFARALRVPTSTSDEELRASFARAMSTNSSGAVE